MNEHLFAEFPATTPQHTRRIISDPLRLLSYCTVCGWYRYTVIGDEGLSEVLVAWLTHLEEIAISQNRAAAAARLICTCLSSEGFEVESEPSEHNSWCRIHDGPYQLIPPPPENITDA